MKKSLRTMICKELKNISENIFGFRKRLTLNKAENDDTTPLTESLFQDHLKSSVDSLRSCRENVSEKQAPLIDHTMISDSDSAQTLIDTSRLPEHHKSPDKTTSVCSSKQQYSLSADGEEFQEDWSFTWYDFDGRGKITRKDMSTMMKSLYDIIRHNTKNRNSRFINHYKLHLVLMTEDMSNVQGLDLATSYEKIYHMDSVITSLTNLSAVSSDVDDQDSDNTIGNVNSTRRKHPNRKSFSGRCFEELHEMRARKQEKRSKSTPTENKRHSKIREEHHFGNTFSRRDQYSISTSLVSLAGSCNEFQLNKQKMTKEKLKPVKLKSSRKLFKNHPIDIFPNKSLSNSCQNITTNNEFHNKRRNSRKKHTKFRNKQQRKKDLGRKQVEEWLQNDMQKEEEENRTTDVQFIHHHYHHYHQSSDCKMLPSTEGLIPIQSMNSIINKTLGSDWTDNNSQSHEYHHHVHLHHHHHHYFY